MYKDDPMATAFGQPPSRDRKIVLVIPCHRPSPELPGIVSGVLGHENGPQAVVVVDDGNGPVAAPILKELADIPGVTLLRHAVNMGVGAALKTGSRYVLQTWPDAHGVVSADADGQHAAGDIVRVIETLRQKTGCVVLGVRRFQVAPLRSRFGNVLTAMLFRLLAHRRLSDTQTGLRGWPIEACARNVCLAPNGFEYLLECLLAAREPFVEVPIQTIYLDGNRSSHFNPVLDSLRIYFVLLRYCASSLLAWAIDACVFYPVYFATGNLIASQFGARIISATAVFFLARNLVFRSNAPVAKSSVRYAVLAGLSGFVSYSLIRFLHVHWGFAVAPAKLLSESALFIVNFAVQRAFIFTRRGENEKSKAYSTATND